MHVRIVAQGDPDAAPVSYTFERDSDHDGVFSASVENVNHILKRGGRINIYQTLLLLASQIAILPDGKVSMTHTTASGSLSHDKVMIGVPEMTQNVRITVWTENQTVHLTLHSPVRSHTKKPV